jgi:hypothetical protein
MARPKSNPVKAVKRKGPDGSIIRTDYYYRANGMPLGTDYQTALAKAQEMDGIVPEKKLPVTVFSGLCESYMESTQFLGNKKSTQDLNRIYIRRLQRRLGAAPVAGLTKPVLYAFKERLGKEVYANLGKPKEPLRSMSKGEERPMTLFIAKYMMTMLSIVLTHGLRLGVIRGDHPCSNLGGFGLTSEREKIWSAEACEAFLKASTGSVQRLAALLLFTVQRPSDCLQMTWDRVEKRADGRVWLWLTQSKTGELIDVPAHRALAEALWAVEDKTGLVAPAPLGGVWAKRNFAREWDATKKPADAILEKMLLERGYTPEKIQQKLIIPNELQRRDLRRTAMVRMSEAGATTAMIAAVSGHSIDRCQRILDVYIPRTSEIAERGIAAWEADSSVAAPVFVPKSTKAPKVKKATNKKSGEYS